MTIRAKRDSIIGRVISAIGESHSVMHLKVW
jgi:hypothetical protein